MRLLDVLTIQPTDWLSTQVALVWQRDKNNSPSAGDWYSAGTRVSLAFTEHAKLLGEVGHDRLRPKNGADDRMLTKVTGAIAIAAAKGFWARPELRLFYTWALWNKTAAGAVIDSGRIYLDNPDYVDFLSGSLAGIQAEAIW